MNKKLVVQISGWRMATYGLITSKTTLVFEQDATVKEIIEKINIATRPVVEPEMTLEVSE